MNFKKLSELQLAGCATALVLACSSCTSDDDPNGAAAAAGSGSSSGSGSTGSTASGGGNGDGDGSNNLDLPGQPPIGDMGIGGDPGDECADASAVSEVAPVTLLVGLDRSTSMTSDDRWLAVTQALLAFYGDPNSAGLNATLQAFPFDDATKEGGCVAGSYDSPDVPLTELPNAAPFAAFLDPRGPDGWTPTRVVVEGLISQAEAVLVAEPSSTVAIVLVNDGEPLGCLPTSEYNVGAVAELLGTVADRIPTYVIGVGEELDDLHALAEAGGTGTAVLVETTDPAAARVEVLERLNSIRTEIAVCDVPVPAPPAGQSLDPFKVSTEIQDAAGNTTPVPYEDDCATGAGWHYDNLDDPTQISLCPQACQTLKEPGERTLKVVFGCTENPEIVR